MTRGFTVMLHNTDGETVEAREYDKPFEDVFRRDEGGTWREQGVAPRRKLSLVEDKVYKGPDPKPIKAPKKGGKK